jgi:hypothetical protein
MLEQVSTSVKFLAFYTASKQGKTGLTVAVDIYNPSGTQIVTDGSATALGGGLYSYTLTSNNSAEGEYAAIFKTTDATVDAQHIPSLWVLGRAGVENLDAATSSRLPSSSYTAPANSDISAIKSKTDNLPSDPADQSLVESAISALSIPTVVQIRSEMDSNSTKLANLDATISSRSTLTTGDLPSVPSAASVATAVRTELTEISNLDASISSRLASADYTAPTSAPTAAAVASAVRTELTELSNLDASVSSRLASASYTAPTSAPSASTVATAVRTELGTELGRIDQNISSRLADADYTTPPTTAQIASAVEGSLLDENDGQAVLNALVGAIGNQNVDEIALVAAIRSDLERNGGKLDSIPTDAAPSAATVASAVWSAVTKEITGGVVDTLTNSPDVPTESEIATQVRTELSVELGRIDAAVSSRLAPSGTLATVTTLTNAPTVPTAAAIADEVRVELATELARLDAPVSGATAPSAATVATAVRSELSTELARVDAAISTRLADADYTAPANSDVAAVKAVTDALVVERLNNCATTAIVGNLLAQANS